MQVRVGKQVVEMHLRVEDVIEELKKRNPKDFVLVNGEPVQCFEQKPPLIGGEYSCGQPYGVNLSSK